MKKPQNKKLIKWMSYILVVMVLGPVLIVMMLYYIADQDVIEMRAVSIPLIGIEQEFK